VTLLDPSRDPERVVRSLLVSDPDVAALTSTVATSLPAAATFPLVRLVTLGGPGLDEEDSRRNVANVRVEAWATSRATAAELRDACRRVLQAAPLHRVEVAACREVSGPAWNPDPQDLRPRFVWTVQITILQED